jgi:hypothetical protein
MGGERGTTTSKRLAGEICCACRNFLPAPRTPGEKWCERCKPPLKVVYMAFERMQGWRVAFFDSHTQKRLRVMNFEDEDKLLELARRGGALTNLESKQAIDRASARGRVVRFSSSHLSNIPSWSKDSVPQKINFRKRYKPIGFGDRPNPGTVEGYKEGAIGQLIVSITTWKDAVAGFDKMIQSIPRTTECLKPK